MVFWVSIFLFASVIIVGIIWVDIWIGEHKRRKAGLAALEIEMSDSGTYLIFPSGQKRKVADHRMDEYEIKILRANASDMFREAVKGK